MTLLALYWSFLICGYVLCKILIRRGITCSWVSHALMGAVYGLCIIMGLRMGVNQQVTSNLGSIGIMALVMSLCCIIGSMGAVTVLRKIFGMDRYGDIKKLHREDMSSAAEGEESKLDIKNTLTILALVVAGMAAGALVLAKFFGGWLEPFDAISNTCLVILLCILMFFVGFDLGASGNILEEFKKVGAKAIAFPVAAVIGTVVVGGAAGLVLGFSLKEGLAISIGFGWYTYAPAVISSAGSEYVIAGAVSFVYNVIRETAGIIFIPVVAKKIGYIESTAVPGVAAMDVCMPIVERSCRPDTIIYSFATGLVMCVVTSAGVPLIMG